MENDMLYHELDNWESSLDHLPQDEMVQGHTYALTPCQIYPEVEKLLYFATFGIHPKKSQLFLQV